MLNPTCFQDGTVYHHCPDAHRRFWAKVIQRGPDECWHWTGSNCQGGYGTFLPHFKFKGAKAYRYSYEILVGPIPQGLVLDHLCRVRACVNPAHLEPVTHAENIRRGAGLAPKNLAKTHCPNGHEYDWFWRGYRLCRTCKRRQGREADRRRHAARKARAG